MPDLVPMFWNPSTGQLMTAKELGEWATSPMTDEEMERGFPYQGGYAGMFDLDPHDREA